MLSLVALLLAGTAPAATAPKGSVVREHGRLRVVGTQVVDAKGRPIALRGASLFWSQWQPQFYDRATVDVLAREWKADVVRAAIGVDGGRTLPSTASSNITIPSAAAPSR
ncbi:hypothetical protein AB5I41_13140 [Sphingomonas sp. MMS24-JH45]